MQIENSEKEKGYNEVLNDVIEILTNSRLNDKTAFLFKDLIKTLKSAYGVEITREFLKGLFPQNPQIQHNLNLKISRILKKAEIKTAELLRFYQERTTKKGRLYFCYKKQTLKRLIV